jgi:hypothetical protein
MGLRYNPFTGSFDLTRSPGSYIDGEVAAYSDLPLDAAAAPLNSAWLVRAGSGLWLLTRKPAGIYIRTATGGTDRDADYTYAGVFPDVFNDANFLLYDNGDTTKNLQFQLSGIDTATTRTLTVPNASGTLPLLETANTYTQNQTLDGTNNTAPNQTAASGSSVMTRDLVDKRLLAAPIFYTGGMLVNMSLSGGASLEGLSPQFAGGNFTGAQCPNSVATSFRIPCPDFVAGRSVTVTSYWGPRNLSASTGNIHIRTFFAGSGVDFQTTLQEISTTGLGLAADLKTVSVTFTATASLPSGIFNHLVIQRRGNEANDTWEAGVTMWGIKLELA